MMKIKEWCAPYRKEILWRMRCLCESGATESPDYKMLQKMLGADVAVPLPEGWFDLTSCSSVQSYVFPRIPCEMWLEELSPEWLYYIPLLDILANTCNENTAVIFGVVQNYQKTGSVVLPRKRPYRMTMGELKRRVYWVVDFVEEHQK